MSRPRIVRADTLDLQDQHSPSAKDHSKYLGHSNSLGPHQEQAMRQAEQETRTEMMHGPDLETDRYRDGTDLYDDTEDIHGGLGVHQRGDGVGEGAEEGELTDGESDDMLDDDLMDKISSSPSIDDEDIDFEFVYALHNFVATVDGQANAAKGDTMVLLDDSNSYWWLVRIVKDGSIGYLPAEHIETPTERLARLNKHRNVDLSATMLGDNSEKSKNPLKKAMRRRNAKTVTFTSPTYIEASDIEYSTDEELDDIASFTDDYSSRDGDDIGEDQNEDIVVEPLRPKAQRDKGSEEVQKVQVAQEPESINSEKQRSSQEIFEPEAEVVISRSRNGTVRNTDSFFKDDTVETKKISLTPNLLRDEVGSSSLTAEPKEGRGSLEAIDKFGPNDRGKDDKKRKDKKPGMLSGLFKRKDKKTKTNEDDTEEVEKHSGELSRSSPTPKTSSESVSSPEARSTKSTGPQRQTSKLQKPQADIMAAALRNDSHQEAAKEVVANDGETAATQEKKADTTIRQVVLDEVEEIAGSSRHRVYEPDHKGLSLSTAAPSPSKDQPSSSEAPNEWQNMSDQNSYSQQPLTSPSQKFTPKPATENQTHLFDSPVSATTPERHYSPSAPGLDTGVSPTGDHSTSPDSPPISPATEITDNKGVETALTASETPISMPPWSDSSLRSYLEDDNDIRDLYLIVHDNSNIPPAGPDHPITGSLFKEESKRLKEMTSQLDSLLAEWVGQRMKTSMSR